MTAKPLVIGRGEADIVLNSRDISRRHARVSRKPDGVVLEDLGSANGTYLNGTMIQQRSRLQFGDRIQLGSTILVFTRHDELEERLQQLQKLDAMAAMVKGIAHDFNNMLTVVQVGLDDLATSLPSDAPATRRTLDDMLHATDSAAAMVRRLMRIGRNRPPTTELVRLPALIAETVMLAQRLRLERVKFMTNVPDDTLVAASREELRNVFMNLILNARDAMPHGGEITISAATMYLDRATALAQHLPSEGGYVQITVTDTGTGMDDSTLTRIFEPFFTTKAAGKGSGLGLAMVFSTVRNHHGAVTVDSELGRGTTFRIILPKAIG